jgi:hypothetical protein
MCCGTFFDLEMNHLSVFLHSFFGFKDDYDFWRMLVSFSMMFRGMLKIGASGPRALSISFRFVVVGEGGGGSTTTFLFCRGGRCVVWVLCLIYVVSKAGDMPEVVIGFCL